MAPKSIFGRTSLQILHVEMTSDNSKPKTTASLSLGVEGENLF